MSKIVIRRFWGNHEIKYTLTKDRGCTSVTTTKSSNEGRKPSATLSDDIIGANQHKYGVYRKVI